MDCCCVTVKGLVHLAMKRERFKKKKKHATRRGNSMFSVIEQVLQVEFLPYATEQKLRRTIVYDVKTVPNPTPPVLPTRPVFVESQSGHWCGVDPAQ